MTISQVTSSLATAASRRAPATPASSGAGFTAEAAGPQGLPSSPAASQPARSGLIAPSSFAALMQAQTPQPDDSGLTLTGLRLPSPRIGRPGAGGGDLRDHAFTSTPA